MGLEPQPQHNGIICYLTVIQDLSQIPKIWANNSCGNGMALDEAVPLQHMNDLRHLLDGDSGCGNHPMWDWSLNHCNMVSFVTLL